MIAQFPSFYPDELVYSLLARYYVHSGYVRYVFAAEDLFQSKTVRPDIEFVNQYTPAALQMITRDMPMEKVIENHTMFPYYGRFLQKERRNKAFEALVQMQGNYYNLLPIPKRKDDSKRYLRFCPLCAENDRRQYGEAYWHRNHQFQGVKICPLHRCYLINSSLLISGKASPTLLSAEVDIPQNTNNVTLSDNEIEHKVANYIARVFQLEVDLQWNVTIGQFLDSRLENTPYKSIRGEQRNITQFHTDFAEYYKKLSGNWFTELWQIQKVLTDDRVNCYEICLLSLFLNIPAADLVDMTLPEKSQQQMFDEQIYRLHKQGLKYPAIAAQLGASANIVKSIGEGRYGTYHKQPRKPLKCGAKPKDWEQIDADLLPNVKGAISQLQGDGITRPKRVTPFAVEKIVGLHPKQLDNLPACKAEIQKHYLRQKEYWALEVAWAANTIVRSNMPLNWKHIRELTNMRKKDLVACMPYLPRYANAALYQKVQLLL